ncbi:MAG: energy-coupling factor transporter transmembrane component T [Microbacteriaceae bacterium]
MSVLSTGIRMTTPATIARVNPVAKLAVALTLSIALLLSIDWVSATVALACEAVLLPFCGLNLRQFLLRTTPVWIAAPFAGVTTVLYGQDSGMVLWQWGFLSVTDGSLSLGVAIALRVLAIGLPGVVLFASTDPTDLADGLAQILHLPARFVLGGLAGLRLVGLFLEDWRALGMARRARGVGDGRGILGGVTRTLSQAFALLVLSVRRGSKLATAMEAKGFGSTITRTWARPSRLHPRDGVVLGIGVLIAAAAITMAIAAGTWHFVLS